jgi:hypothetical protein
MPSNDATGKSTEERGKETISAGTLACCQGSIEALGAGLECAGEFELSCETHLPLPHQIRQRWGAISTQSQIDPVDAVDCFLKRYQRLNEVVPRRLLVPCNAEIAFEVCDAGVSTP